MSRKNGKKKKPFSPVFREKNFEKYRQL